MVWLFFHEVTPLPGRRTEMKFDVKKIFQKMRRTAREYSQQASGGRKVHCFIRQGKKFRRWF